MNFDPQPVTLAGKFARLEPLDARHFEDLSEVASDPSIWTYLSCNGHTREGLEAWLSAALIAMGKGIEVPFAIIDAQNGQVVGSTRYMDLRRAHRGLEIGWTWLGIPAQRTAVNTEAKLLLLQHAFEELGALRVQLKTDARNLRSQRAIERIGGVREGVLRSHMICLDGSIRDSVYFSILDREWPEVKQRLVGKLCALTTASLA